MNTKEERIAVRVNRNLYVFLRDFAKDNGMTLSELIRHVLVYWHMDFLLGHIKKPYKDLQKEFFDFADQLVSRKKLTRKSQQS
jgi:hypothetical protein